MKFCGRKLKDAREAAGLSQRELARKLGINYQSISSYELGDSTPKADLIPNLAFVLDKHFSFFFENDSDTLHTQEPEPDAGAGREITSSAGGL